MKAAQQLLRWYGIYGRRLPWRRTRNPYRILVSEVMLQQTQVDRVKGFYAAWLKRFPTFAALAEASNADVLHAWAGLGYNRRALVLRDIARYVAVHGVPKTYEGWLAIKGIGPYTAAAIMAFAFKEARLPIDTNIRRFVGRFLLGKPYPQPSDDQRITKKSEDVFLTSSRAFDLPQAMFDLATMHCTKVPNCAACPMRQSCLAAERFLSGRVQTPKQMVRKGREMIHRNKRYPDRIYRGRLLRVIRTSSTPVRLASIGLLIDDQYDAALDQDWVLAMVGRLEADQMVAVKRGMVSLA